MEERNKKTISISKWLPSKKRNIETLLNVSLKILLKRVKLGEEKRWGKGKGERKEKVSLKV